MTHDPRYVQFDEMHAIIDQDKRDVSVTVATTRDLADRFQAAQWDPSQCRIESVRVIRHLPEIRTLYMIEARLPYGTADHPEPQVDEYGEFPGLGNGEMVLLGQVISEVSEQVPYGWNVKSVAWDLDQARAAFGNRMAEARRLRDMRNEAFGRFGVGCVVRTSAGITMIRTVARAGGVLCWSSGPKVVHDAEVDPASLTVIAEAG